MNRSDPVVRGVDLPALCEVCDLLGYVMLVETESPRE